MNKFEKKIQKKMLDFEVEPPQEIWQAIESRLDSKEKAKPFYWRNIAAAAAVLLLLISASMFVINLFNDSAKQFTQDSTQESTALRPSQSPSSSDQQEDRNIEIPSEKPLLATKTPSSTSTLVSAKRATNDIEPVLVQSFASPSYIAELKPLVTLIPSSSPTDNRNIENKTPILLTSVNLEQLAAINQSKIEIASNYPAASSLSLSAYFAPQQSYRFQNGNVSNPMQSLESQLMSFSSGVLLNYKITPRWEVQTGLGYNLLGQSVHDIASFSHPSMMPLYSADGSNISSHPQSMSTSMGGIIFTDQSLYFADVSSSRIITLKGSYDESNVNLLNKSGSGLIQHFEYLEIPVAVRYKLFEKGLSVFAKVGASANYLLAGNVFLQGKPQNSPIGQSVGISKFNFGAMGGMVFSYPVSNRINVSLEPTATMFLRPMGQVKNLTKETYPYTWSVFMGVSYKI